MKTELIVNSQHVQDGLLVVDHLSYSAIRAFAESENMFFRKYVRREFDKVENPSFMIGKAVHAVLDCLWQDRIAGEEKTSIWYQELGKEELEAMIAKAHAKVIEEKDIKPLWVTTDEEGKETKFFTPEQIAEIDAAAIKWSAKVNKQTAQEMVRIAISNYLANIDNTTPIATEIAETVVFSDLDGEVMPVPLKGIIDKIERDPELGEGLRDYKVVASFSDPTKRKPSYEIQAAYFYFVYQGIRGKAPDYAVFDEIIKKEPGYILPEEPDRRLLQADLRELCEKHGLGWEKFEKNAQLQDKLVLGGVLVKEPGVKRIVYKYAERQDILEAAIELYKRIVNRLGIIALYDVNYQEIANPFSQFGGEENWLDFVEGLGQDTMKKQEKQEEENLEDTEDFDY